MSRPPITRPRRVKAETAIAGAAIVIAAEIASDRAPNARFRTAMDSGAERNDAPLPAESLAPIVDVTHLSRAERAAAGGDPRPRATRPSRNAAPLRRKRIWRCARSAPRVEPQEPDAPSRPAAPPPRPIEALPPVSLTAAAGFRIGVGRNAIEGCVDA